jgi:hypothetical protein
MLDLPPANVRAKTALDRALRDLGVVEPEVSATDERVRLPSHDTQAILARVWAVHGGANAPFVRALLLQADADEENVNLTPDEAMHLSRALAGITG